MGINSILDPIFRPLLIIGPLWAILIISIIISLIITLAYKYFTNQEEMKRLKGEIKDTQKSMKEMKDDPQKMMSMQKESMKKNMEYMKHSMKPTLITFIPIIIIFGWLNANLAFEPILPEQEFTTTIILEKDVAGMATITVPNQIEILDQNEKEIINNEVSWKLKGSEGNYLLEFSVDGGSASKELLIDEEKYSEPVSKIKNSKIKEIRINNNKIKPFEFTGIPWVMNWGWLGAYILFSIIFSMGLRKLFKLY